MTPCKLSCDIRCRRACRGATAPHPLQQSRLLLERIDWRLEAAQVVDVAWEVGAAGIGGVGVDVSPELTPAPEAGALQSGSTGAMTTSDDVISKRTTSF